MKQQQQIVTLKDLHSVNNMLYELLCLRRWSEVTVTNGKFTEVAKQGLNCMISFFWAIEIAKTGVEVDFTKFPKLALFRGFTKTLQCDVSESNLDIIFQLGNVSKASFQEMIWDAVEKSTSKNFFQHLQVNPDCLEARIYRAATKVSTLLELREIRGLIAEKDYLAKEGQLQSVISEFSDLPCYEQIMSDSYQEIFRSFSKLRNRIRWAKHPNIVQCSVLGHMFDVACYAYLMSLDVKPSDEMLATQYFFMGIFHDFPECWTGDMPSPIKDSLPGLRKATELFENMVMEQNVYSYLPTYMAEAIRSVMLEDDGNVQYKVFLKKSDNFSAFVECWREIDAGSHHYYYRTVINSDYKKKENLPQHFRRLMEDLYNFCLS
ncbi:MAG: HD domain-containing protein [Clostridia bacterium]|nr:HD domain-containing protein [Clostridia bacterium]